MDILWVNGYQERASGAAFETHHHVIMLLVAKSITDCTAWEEGYPEWIIPLIQVERERSTQIISFSC